MPDNPGGLVYGLILVATLLSAESARNETYLETVGAVVISLLVYWLSVSYSEFTGERVERGEHFEYAAFGHQATRQLSLLYGAAVPLLALLVFWAAGATLSTAVSVAIWSAVGMLVVIELAIGIKTDLSGRDLLRQTLLGILLALLVIALRVLLH